jgi:hypothetical protein
VLGFCAKLRLDGVDCKLDQLETSPPEGWPRWMLKTIGEVDFVLVVATAPYRQRFEVPDGMTGKGVAYEGLVITHEIYNNSSKNTKFIPVVFAAEDIASIPVILQGTSHYNVLLSDEYEKLLGQVTAQQLIRMPEAGPVRKLVPKEVPTHRFIDQPQDGSFEVEERATGWIANAGTDETGQCIGTVVDTRVEFVELTLDRDFDSFTEKDQECVVDAIKNLLKVSGGLRVIQRKRGSVKLLLEVSCELVERLGFLVDGGRLDELSVTAMKQVESPDAYKQREVFNQQATFSPLARHQEVLDFAESRYEQSPDWVTFFREVLGVDGAARKAFPTFDELSAFEQSEHYDRIQKLLVKLRERRHSDDTESEPTRVITIRLPKSMHESLRTEAHDLRTSMNKLCISKLLQVIGDEMIPRSIDAPQEAREVGGNSTEAEVNESRVYGGGVSADEEAFE